MEKTKEKQQKTKSSDPCPLPGLSPDLAHGSELFLFCFLEVLAKLQKTMEKQKKTKSSDPCPLPGLSPDPVHGSELFFFFFVFWFFHGFFHVFHVFHVKMLSSQYLSKNARFLQFAHLRPPGQTAKKNMEKPKEPKSSDPCPLPGLSPGPCPWVYFFCFLEVLSKLQKPMKKTKTKITRSSDLCPLPTMSMGLIFFFGYLVVLAKLQKPWQNQNKQKNKSLDSRPLSSLSLRPCPWVLKHFVCFGFLEVCFF